MNRCVLAAGLFNVLSQYLVSARSLVVIDVGALRRHLEPEPAAARAHRARRAAAAAAAADEFRPADYLRTALSILHSYNDADLEEAVADLAQELTPLRYINNGLYDIVIDKVSDLQNKPTHEIKEKILDWMQLLESGIFTDLTLRLKSVNEMQAAAELMNILQILDNYRYRSKKRSFDLVEAVKSSLRSAVNYVLGPEPTTPTTPAPPPPPPPSAAAGAFSVSPRTMRAMVEAVNFAYKWIDILSEKKKDENLNKVLRTVKFPKKERDLLRQNLNVKANNTKYYVKARKERVTRASEKDSDVLEQLSKLSL